MKSFKILRHKYAPRRLSNQSGWLRASAVAAGVLLALLTTGCQHPMALLQPAGPAASMIADLWWLMFGLSMVVVVIVVGLLLVTLLKQRRRKDEPVDGDERVGRRMVILGGVVLPVIIIVIVMYSTLDTFEEWNSYSEQTQLTVRTEAFMFWWDFRYPAYGFATANEMHIPAGEPVRIELHGGDVIHSFWVPELQGKEDLAPGLVRETWLQADEPGVYRGQCAEFCGRQHANMAFLVVAETPDDFAAWLEREQQPAPEPADELTQQGLQVFLGSACVSCHTIRGTNASGEVGPDLTHLASRRELGAGTLPNTPGNLAGWIVNPQAIKPGNRMPPTLIEGGDLQALLAYLESLQ